MFARFEHALQINEAAVALHEIAVDLRWNLSCLQEPGPVQRANLTLSGQPAQGVGIDLVTGDLTTAHLLDNTVAL